MTTPAATTAPGRRPRGRLPRFSWRPRPPWARPARRALVVHCHPLAESFTSALRDQAVAALAGEGVEVRVADLYADGFDPAFGAAEHRAHLEPGGAPDVARYVDDLRWCDTLVLVYPTWWAGQPAMLKGWIDRVWVCGVAWELPAGTNRLRGLLRNLRTIVVVTTHGSSKLVNAVEGEGGKRTVTRGLRSLCHPLTRTTWCAFYGCDRRDAAAREAFLARVGDRLAALAH